MGNSRSVSVSGNGAEHNGGQLFVSLKLHKSDGQPLAFNAVPHITGSLPIVGLWDPAKAVSVFNILIPGCWRVCSICFMDFMNNASVISVYSSIIMI